MGHVYSTYIGSPETSPDFRNPPTFDANYGFENGRKERVMIATENEMDAATLKPHERDYCAHLIIDFYKCRADVFPFVSRCLPERDAWSHCEYDDYVLRMKEYERERRLLMRAKRKGTLGEQRDSEELAQ